MSVSYYDVEAHVEAPTRECVECKEDFTPSWEHDNDLVCDECVSENGKKQILRKVGDFPTFDEYINTLMKGWSGKYPDALVEIAKKSYVMVKKEYEEAINN
jgi:hypothetical protein